MKKTSFLVLTAGFTLIELMVAITLLALLMGGGIAGYIRVNDRQNLVNAGKNVQLFMREAQKKARVGERPAASAGCGALVSYQLKTSATLDQVNLNAECDNAVTSLIDSYTFPNGVVASSAFDMHFYALQGGVKNSGQVVLHSKTRSYTFTVDGGGSIGDAVVAPYP
jgi:prepilin-type N-terminal cleavage/methylation domain-containing protein